MNKYIFPLLLIFQIINFISLSFAALLTLQDWRQSSTAFDTLLSNEQWNQMEELQIKLIDWNTKVNLVSRKDVEMLVPNHIIPSVAVIKVRKFSGGETCIDIGCGGGFPGLPLAIACPDAHFTLLDSNGKKMAVVQDIADSLQLKNVRVINARAEAIQEKFDFMLGRAVSAIPSFLQFSAHLLAEDSKSPMNEVPMFANSTISSGLLYIKGGDYTQELQDADIQNSISFSIQQLLNNQLETDKNVLYIPGDQIKSFHKRAILNAEILAASKITNNKQGDTKKHYRVVAKKAK